MDSKLSSPRERVLMPHTPREREVSTQVDEKAQLSADFAQLVNNPHLSDISFILEEGKTVFAHRVILAARSQMFRALLFGGMKESRQSEIIIEDVKTEVFVQLMEYLYTGCVTLSDETVIDLFAAANRYGIETLLMKCGSYLSETINNEKNVCSLLEMAYVYNETHLFEKCFQYMEQHTSAVLKDPSFLNLPEELVVRLLQSDDLQTEEVDLFQATLKWGQRQLEIQSTDSSLGKVLENILPYIRFPCMTADDLFIVVKPMSIVPMEDLFEAMTYHASPNSLDTTSKKFFPRRFRKMKWEVDTKSKELLVDEMLASVWRPGSIGCFPVIRTSEVFTNGLVEVRIEHLPDKGNITSIGIATIPAFLQLRDGVLGNRVVGRVKESYGYVKLAQPPGDSYVFADGMQVANPVASYSDQDIIGVKLDSSKRFLTFYKNGQPLGPQQSIAPGEYHLVVSLSNDAKISLL